MKITACFFLLAICATAIAQRSAGDSTRAEELWKRRDSLEAVMASRSRDSAAAVEAQRQQQQKQDAEARKDLDRGKAEMKRNDPEGPGPDYAKAVKWLEQAVNGLPDNPEAWYFYGYALDRLNTLHGIQATTPSLTAESSRAFEKCLALSKDVYSGDLLLLDPHTKILTAWGALGLRYRYENKPDSSEWAYHEAVQRGGVNYTVLNYFKQVLDECGIGSYLFSNGDMYLYYIGYLQEVEKYRTDVRFIDLNLLNTPWYPGWLVSRGVIKTSFAPADLIKLDMTKWEAKDVTVPVHTVYNGLPEGDSAIHWNLAPTYGKKYILRSDRILLNILQQNAFVTEVNFAADVPAEMELYATAFLQCRGLTLRMFPSLPTDNLDAVADRLKRLNYLPVGAHYYLNNRDNIQVLNNYRFAYATVALQALKQSRVALAVELMDAVEQKYPESSLPFYAEATRQWFAGLKKKIDTTASAK